MGVGATIYKTWFNDYAPLVINILLEPFFLFTDRTANTFAMLCAVLFPRRWSILGRWCCWRCCAAA